MSRISSFGTFTMARLGINAAQKGIMVTGNNISNINTEGYTRQVVDQEAWFTGRSDRYLSKMDFRIGNGAQVIAVNQLRDQYLDIRYRNEQSSVGAMEAKSEGLADVAMRLDEVGRGEDEGGILELMFNDIVTQMENLATQGAGHDEFDTLFRTATESMLNQLNSTALKLEELREDHIDKFYQNVDDVNSILVRIRDLDVAIRRNQVYGGNSLEQMDARNNLIDELSKYIRINVSYEQEDLGANYSVEKLVITTAGPPERKLVDGIYSARFSVREDENGEDSENFDLDLGILKDEYGRALEETETGRADGNSYDTQEEAQAALDATYQNGPATEDDGRKVENEYTVVRNGDKYEIQKTSTFKGAVELSDTELYGKLQAEREFLTEKGVFATAEDKERDPDASIKRGVQFYQKALDVFANKFAQVINTANQSAGGELLISASHTEDVSTGITATNITVAKDWLNHARRVIIDTNADSQSTANNALRHMLTELTGEHKFTAVEGDQGPDSAATDDNTFFIGTFQEMFTTHIAGTLANDQRTTETMLDNYNALSDEIYVDRDAVDGVDLNDEVMTMMQYQKAYQAACRLMTTFDSLLDKLINGTAI